jgi:hypothetical protein
LPEPGPSRWIVNLNPIEIYLEDQRFEGTHHFTQRRVQIDTSGFRRPYAPPPWSLPQDDR